MVRIFKKTLYHYPGTCRTSTCLLGGKWTPHDDDRDAQTYSTAVQLYLASSKNLLPRPPCSTTCSAMSWGVHLPPNKHVVRWARAGRRGRGSRLGTYFFLIKKVWPRHAFSYF